MPAAAKTAPAWLPAAPFLFLGFWSSGFAFAKLGLEHAGPLTCLALRFALAVVMLVPVALVLRPPWPSPTALRHTAVVGCLIQVVYFGLSYVALAMDISAGAVALIVSLQPVLVGILAPRFAGEAVSLRRWLGLVLGLAGAALVIIAKSAVEATSPWAVLAALGSLAGMTAGTLYEKRHGSGLHPVTVSLIQFVIAVVVLTPLALLVEGFAFEPHPELALAIGYLVVANSFVSLTLLLAMIRHGEVSRVSALFFLVPPMAALIAWLMLGETMPLLAWGGMAIAILGVALATRSELERVSPSPTRP
ncbi:MAG: DMT family transporter [Geminicoccaceae bacterium]|nr:MAG: DMT family transporter [Geminicoccaceae bacterium]